MSDVAVRNGGPDELVAVMRVLDAGLLEMAASEVRDRLETGDCLVADASGRVVGVLVLDGDYVEAVAVSQSRRGRGIGTTLVETALDRQGRLVAEFDAGVRPFYESLGFAIEPADDGRPDGRLRGILDRSHDPS
ncbi:MULTISPECIES: GNAT family N-acetyltransferase [Haloferax]|uniref:GNAT family N-acetyltransferase n=1 Tax=Haloferax marinum TaxID=2666143 RepID=A0A6A8G6Y4_9EURY|nr:MULTISPECIES: GNAT family N-acetyltransferase [Haloferax]KAB1197530.1 GNAT family N-acetyltransferase [Haloferax sp. CBA1150]MRW96577.1 GNAT family N-acetyltransferase [Haloferax marinum]